MSLGSRGGGWWRCWGGGWPGRPTQDHKAGTHPGAQHGAKVGRAFGAGMLLSPNPDKPVVRPLPSGWSAGEIQGRPSPPPGGETETRMRMGFSCWKTLRPLAASLSCQPQFPHLLSLQGWFEGQR